jgi:hypothetical protein
MTEQDLTALKTDVAEIKDTLRAMYPLLIAVNARGEEQSKRIDDLSRMMAALVPQKIAAVGGK